MTDSEVDRSTNNVHFKICATLALYMLLRDTPRQPGHKMKPARVSRSFPAAQQLQKFQPRTGLPARHPCLARLMAGKKKNPHSQIRMLKK